MHAPRSGVADQRASEEQPSPPPHTYVDGDFVRLHRPGENQPVENRSDSRTPPKSDSSASEGNASGAWGELKTAQLQQKPQPLLAVCSNTRILCVGAIVSRIRGILCRLIRELKPNKIRIILLACFRVVPEDCLFGFFYSQLNFRHFIKIRERDETNTPLPISFHCPFPWPQHSQVISQSKRVCVRGRPGSRYCTSSFQLWRVRRNC